MPGERQVENILGKIRELKIPHQQDNKRMMFALRAGVEGATEQKPLAIYAPTHALILGKGQTEKRF